MFWALNRPSSSEELTGSTMQAELRSRASSRIARCRRHHVRPATRRSRWRACGRRCVVTLLSSAREGDLAYSAASSSSTRVRDAVASGLTVVLLHFNCGPGTRVHNRSVPRQPRQGPGGPLANRPGGRRGRPVQHGNEKLIPQGRIRVPPALAHQGVSLGPACGSARLSWRGRRRLSSPRG
jgi:hypothetical protein